MMGSQFDTLIHAPNRLQICALLASAASMEFAIIKDQLDVSDSVLSKHLKSLEDAGYVLLDKKVLHGRQRTWLSLTKEGHKAFSGHVAALKEIVG
jgi:DNA-binding MarR family transcriptional regulator